MTSRILLVDDSRTTLEVIKVHLMNRGYEFATAPNASEALVMSQARPPDLVISDLFMPSITGLDLCRKFRLTPGLQKVPFIVVTAKKEDSVRREAFAAGIDGFLRKPIDATQLQLLVTKLLTQRRSDAGPR